MKYGNIAFNWISDFRNSDIELKNIKQKDMVLNPEIVFNTYNNFSLRQKTKNERKIIGITLTPSIIIPFEEAYSHDFLLPVAIEYIKNNYSEPSSPSTLIYGCNVLLGDETTIYEDPEDVFERITNMTQEQINGIYPMCFIDPVSLPDVTAIEPNKRVLLKYHRKNFNNPIIFRIKE